MNIDFEGLIAGQPFEGNKAANFTVVLGEERMLPGLRGGDRGHEGRRDEDLPAHLPAGLRRGGAAARPRTSP